MRYKPNSALRYIVEEDTKKAIKKAQEKKAGKQVQKKGEPIFINPDKNIVAQGTGGF